MSGLFKGVVVLGHGSRAGYSEANQIIFTVADMMKAKLGHDLVEPAILTVASGQQTLAEAVYKLALRGINSIVVTPMFFSAGSHIRDDVPTELEQISRSFPGVTIVLSKPIGADPRIAEILCDRVEQTFAVSADKG